MFKRLRERRNKKKSNFLSPSPWWRFGEASPAPLSPLVAPSPRSPPASRQGRSPVPCPRSPGQPWQWKPSPGRILWQTVSSVCRSWGSSSPCLCIAASHQIPKLRPWTGFLLPKESIPAPWSTAGVSQPWHCSFSRSRSSRFSKVRFSLVSPNSEF